MSYRSIEVADVQGLSEDQLVMFAKQGEHNAFQELMRRTEGTCLSIAIGILGNRDDAADEVQNAFWRAFTRIDTFSQQARFATWVTRIVINLCYMRLRRVKRLRFVTYDGISQDGEAYSSFDAVDCQTPEGCVCREQMSALVRAEVRRIPKILRVPLELYYLEDVPIEAVAKQLNLSVPAAKSRLHRAQLYLRNRMIRHCGTHGAVTLLSAVA